MKTKLLIITAALILAFYHATNAQILIAADHEVNPEANAAEVKPNAKKNAGWRHREPEWTSRNSIAARTSLLYFTSYDTAIPLPVYVEFDRFFRDRWSWSALLHFSHFGIPDSDRDNLQLSLCAASVSLSGKVNYTVPLIKNILYLRIGAGLGLSYFYDARSSWGLFIKDEQNGITAGPVTDKLRPTFVFDMLFIIRASRWLDVTISPLLFLPSTLIYTPWPFNEPLNDKHYSAIDILSIGIRVRF